MVCRLTFRAEIRIYVRCRAAVDANTRVLSAFSQLPPPPGKMRTICPNTPPLKMILISLLLQVSWVSSG